MRELWYKNAVFYSLDVETFMDSNGDGIGDFQGLTHCLDYLAALGINCLWLLPFYPSPNRDAGYDVMDYYNVDPRLGTLGDFVEFMHSAHERGIRVLIDLVVNHTSEQHPWFQEARSNKDSKYRDYYIWSDEAPPDEEVKTIFPDVESNIWHYDEKAEAYYLHRFYREQPDLNSANPAVREEILKIMGFWLELGVSGFRIDAAPYLLEPIGVDVDLEELKHFMTEMREFMSSRRTDAVLLAEANVSAEELPPYFGNGDRMHLLFNFLLNQYKFLAFARQDQEPLLKVLKLLPDIPHNCQWLNFVRHHDELTLDCIEDEEREEIFQAFAPEDDMQIYGRGVRRRLPPMLGGDRRQLEMIYSLSFSLPGAPLLRYGEEIGMGDDLSLDGRDSVRTPMQWSNSPNGGFSSAAAEKLPHPVIDNDEYGYHKVNVVAQQREPNSLLNWMERLIRTRRQCPELGAGQYQVLQTDEPSVFAHRFDWGDRAVLMVHNLAGKPCSVTLKSGADGHLTDLFSDRSYEPIDGHTTAILLESFGYRWFRVNH
jgi:maltose alpha-D-glucosyltransferase/alpha-amylase